LAELYRPNRDPMNQEVLLCETLDCPVICRMGDIDEILDWMTKLDGRFKEVYLPGEEYIRIVRNVH